MGLGSCRPGKSQDRRFFDKRDIFTTQPTKTSLAIGKYRERRIGVLSDIDLPMQVRNGLEAKDLLALVVGAQELARRPQFGER